MYAEKKLWPGARAFLFWRLNDPNVQRANSLNELLCQLKLGFTTEKCQDITKVLLSLKGENVILALDGVDELNTASKGYVKSLLDGSELEKACVLVTSRPCSTA